MLQECSNLRELTLGMKNAFTITVWGTGVHFFDSVPLFTGISLTIFLQHFCSATHFSYTGFIYLIFSVVVQGFLYSLLVFSL